MTTKPSLYAEDARLSKLVKEHLIHDGLSGWDNYHGPRTVSATLRVLDREKLPHTAIVERIKSIECDHGYMGHVDCEEESDACSVNKNSVMALVSNGKNADTLFSFEEITPEVLNLALNDAMSLVQSWTCTHMTSEHDCEPPDYTEELIHALSERLLEARAKA